MQRKVLLTPTMLLGGVQGLYDEGRYLHVIDHSTMDRLATLREFLKEDPDDPFTRFAFAQELRNRGDLGSALEVLQELVMERPEYGGTYYHLGKLYEELDRTPEAIRAYHDGITRATESGDQHTRAELQSALLEAQGIGFDD